MYTRYLAIGAVALAVLFTGFAVFYAATRPAPPAAMPSEMAIPDPTPPVVGLYRGQEILFIHTEASDPQVAGMLTMMMGPKVFTVSSLAKIPEELLADVYVFTNGVKGNGPFGFQVDIFDAVPGDPRYTPLRSVILVTWQDGATPRVLGSVEEIQEAIRKGEVSIERPGIVVNMPMLSWPGGQR